jgi:hypothetical protein
MRSGTGPDNDDLPVVSENQSPISRINTFFYFIEGLSEDNLNSQLRRMASANPTEDVSLIKVFKDLSHLPCLSSLTFTASALFDTFSISSRLLHSASTGLHEVCALLLSSCLWVSLSCIWDFWKAGQQLVVQEVQYDLLDKFTILGSFSAPEAAPIMREYVDIVNSYIEHEFIHCRNVSHVPHYYEITRTKFLSWEPLSEPLSITIKCVHPDDLSSNEHVTSHVFKKLYLEPLLHSYSSLMLGTTVSKNFDKESTAWRLFEGRMHFLKELDSTLRGDLFFFPSWFSPSFPLHV